MEQERPLKRFCPSCGENADTLVMEKAGNSPGEITEELCCNICGMLVEDRCKKEVTPADSILIADDSQMMREFMHDALTASNLCRMVVTSNDGSEFITRFSRGISEKKRFSLVVLDVAMPVLNGINAAIAMRAIEKALKMKATPILFCTAYKCDENFRKVLSFCTPARYLNKGSSSTPDMLATRIKQIVELLL